MYDSRVAVTRWQPLPEVCKMERKLGPACQHKPTLLEVGMAEPHSCARKHMPRTARHSRSPRPYCRQSQLLRAMRRTDLRALQVNQDSLPSHWYNRSTVTEYRFASFQSDDARTACSKSSTFSPSPTVTCAAPSGAAAETVGDNVGITN
jgi:hypothetical protein